jgi:hypothetical protein
MSNHHHDEGGDLHFEQISHHGVNYEPRDLGGRGIIAFLIVLVISTAVLAGTVWGYYAYHLKHPVNEPARTGIAMVTDTPVTQPDPTKRFPRPTLQPDDVADLSKMRADENEILNSYGWVDQANGVARIPVDQAMKMVAQQGLPARPQQVAPQGAQFGNGTDTVPGIAGGTRPEVRQ